MLKPATDLEARYLVLAQEPGQEPIIEWHVYRDTAVASAEALKRDAIDSGAPIYVYVCHLELRS